MWKEGVKNGYGILEENNGVYVGEFFEGN